MATVASTLLPVRQGSGPWRRELDDFLRALGGAFLFGAPLLFTMEMWWLGTFAEPSRLLLLIGVALAANLGLNSLIGFKRGHSFGTAVEATIDAVAVGALASLVVLLALNQVKPDEPLLSALGKVVVQVLPLSLGASTANGIFGRGTGRQGPDDETEPLDPWRATLRDVAATAIGGIFLGFSIAPTEEIPMLAAELTFAHQLALIVLSLVLTYGIVFECTEGARQRRPHEQDIFRSPISETAMAYALSLLVALAAILLLNRATLETPLPYLTAQTLVLGLPTALGGAAGRLVVGG